MYSCTHAAPSHSPLEHRKLPDPSLYRQPENAKDTDALASPRAHAPGVASPKQAGFPDGPGVLSGIAVPEAQPLSPTSPQPPLTPPGSPPSMRRRSFSAFFHRH